MEGSGITRINFWKQYFFLEVKTEKENLYFVSLKSY